MTRLPKKPENILEKLAENFTRWLGSVYSLIIHTCLFFATFGLWVFGVPLERVLLILTTWVSLEAIYLSLFIQMSVNRNTQSLAEVEEDVAEIAEDVEEVQKDIDEIAEDVGEIQQDVDEIAEDVGEIEKDVDEIQKDVDEVQEDVEELSGEDEKQHLDKSVAETLTDIQNALARIAEEVERLKR